MKKSIAMILSLVLAMSLLAACGGSSSSPASSGSTAPPDGSASQSASIMLPDSVPVNTEKTDEALVVAVAAEPPTMDPQSPNASTVSMSIQRVLYNRLTEIDPSTNEVLPSFATAWEWVDPLHLRMTLREDVMAADGTPLTADDVLYTFEKAVEVSSRNVTSFINVEETTVESDTSIVIGLVNADNAFPGLLANAEFSICSRSATEAAGGLDGAMMSPTNGSGKYRFVEWKPGESLTVERNEDYWDADYSGYYKTIKYVFIADAAARILAVQSGDANLAVGLAVNQAMGAEGDNVQVKVMGAGQMANIFFNCESEYFSDARVREAARLLIDVNAISQAMTTGKAPVSNSMFAPTNPYYYDAFKAAGDDRAVNVERAKELLADAGYPNGFEITEKTQKQAEVLMTLYQAMLGEGGIKMNLEIVDPAASVQNRREGDYHITIVNTFGASGGQTLFQNVLPSQIGVAVGHTRYSEPHWDELLETATTSLDEAEVEEACKEIQQIAYDEALHVPTIEQVEASVLAKGLDGLVAVIRVAVYDVSNVRPVA